jgi:large subunit ribosomal protein L22
VADLLRGLDTDEAENQLRFLIKGSASDLEKLLKSAIANAENNFGLDKKNLLVKDIIVNEGQVLKRWLPRAHGRATLILKKTSNIKIILSEKVEGKGRKKIQKQEIEEVQSKDLKRKKKEAEPAFAKASTGREEAKEEKKETLKEKDEKEFLDEKKKAAESKGFFKKVFRRKSM